MNVILSVLRLEKMTEITKRKKEFERINREDTLRKMSRDIHITYRVLQTIQMKLILLCVWTEPAVLGSAKTALKFIYKI